MLSRRIPVERPISQIVAWDRKPEHRTSRLEHRNQSQKDLPAWGRYRITHREMMKGNRGSSTPHQLRLVRQASQDVLAVSSGGL